jgi:hypothetical protein
MKFLTNFNFICVGLFRPELANLIKSQHYRVGYNMYNTVCECSYKNMKNKQKEWHRATKPI